MKSKIISFVLIAVATIVVLYFSLKDDYETIINTILSVNKWWLLFSFFLLFLFYFFRSLCMYLIAKSFNEEYKFRYAFRLTLETNFFHAITPFSTGGQPYEIYSLSKTNKMADAMSISVSNFIVYQIALVFVGLVSLICNQIFKFINNGFLINLISLGFVINFLVIVVLLVISTSKKTDRTIVDFFIDFLSIIKIVKNKEKTKERFHNYLKDFNSGSKVLFKDVQKFVILVIYELISLICLYLIPFALFKGININYLNVIQDIIIMSYVMLIGSFVPIPGGTGGLEYSFVTFFGKFIPGSKVNAMMLVWRFITYYFGMILGAIVLSVKKEKKQ